MDEKTPPNFDGYERLRQQAEEILSGAEDERGGDGSAKADRMARLIHELRVNQVELEMQNEELRRAQTELAEARDRYASLYDEAPVGYLTLDGRGLVIEINRRGAAMLGHAPERLLGKPFLPLVGRDDQSRFFSWCDSIPNVADPGKLEVRLTRHDGSRFYAELEGRPALDRDGGLLVRFTVNDITERRRTEAELSRFRAAVDTSADAIFLVDRRTMRFVDVNQTAVTSLGYSREELMDMGPMELRDEGDPEELAGLYDRVWEGLVDPGVVETRHRRKDGSTFPVEVYIRAARFRGDGPMLVAAARDVSEREKSEQALKRASLLIEKSPAVLFRWKLDQDMTAEYVSRNVSRFGHDRDEVLSGRFPFARLIHPDDLERVRAVTRHQDAEGAEAFTVEYRIQTHSGETRWVVDQATFERDSSGRATHMQGILLDITERKAAERELRLVLEGAPIPVVKVEMRPDGDRVLAYQNPAAAELFGAEALHRSCREILCDNRPCPISTAGLDFSRDMECRVRTRHGDRIMYKTARKARDMPYIIEAMTDVTELMETRERLRAAMEQAEAASRAKSDFLANMSHEIRTPLNGILGMTELALQTDLTPEQREYLDIVRQSGNSLLSIVNDILDLARIESGRFELANESFEPRALLQGLIKLFTKMARRHGDLLELSVDQAVPGRLVGDQGRLRQILTNLVSNALKFTRGGRVSISVSVAEADRCLIEAGHRDRLMMLLFSVADTGIGIPADKHRAIFEYFTQLDTSLTRGVGGTGLGLSISRHLAEMMGGRIGLESTPGKGSVFSFTAAFLTEAPEAACPAPFPRTPPPEPVPRIRPGLRVLLAEDNLVNQLVAKRLLEKKGHFVTTAATGIEALELLARADFDCVLMDVEMPGLDGLETTRRIRDRAVFGDKADIPVVALTAHAIKGYRERLLAAGMNGYASKPIDIRELETALAKATDREAGTAPAGPAPSGGATTRG